MPTNGTQIGLAGSGVQSAICVGCGVGAVDDVIIVICEVALPVALVAVSV
jgi:hypothetical protein